MVLVRNTFGKLFSYSDQMTDIFNLKLIAARDFSSEKVKIHFD